MEWDYSELDDFSRELLQLSQSFERGKEARKFLRREGNKLKRRTVAEAKKVVQKKTGNLFKGIKRGKVYKYYANGAMAIRVYGGKPAYHAHLLNYGHRIVDKNGKEHGFKKGHHFFEKGADVFKEEYYHNIEDFIDEMLDEHGLA